MANRIYLKDNYVIVDDTVTENPFSRGLSVYWVDSSNIYLRNQANFKTFVIPLSDIGTWFLEDGVTPYTQTTLVNLLRLSTGFKTALGSSRAASNSFILRCETDGAIVTTQTCILSEFVNNF